MASIHQVSRAETFKRIATNPQQSANIHQLHCPHTLIPTASTRQTQSTCFSTNYLQLLFESCINKNCKDGSGNLAITAQPKQSYSKPLLKKFFLQTCATRNFGNTKRRMLEELQTSFKNKAIRNPSNCLPLRLKYSP